MTCAISYGKDFFPVLRFGKPVKIAADNIPWEIHDEEFRETALDRFNMRQACLLDLQGIFNAVGNILVFHLNFPVRFFDQQVVFFLSQKGTVNEKSQKE
ncbi:hypothetical protein D3C86_1443830 [compost metagenome]